jgi:hypothetical protein
MQNAKPSRMRNWMNLRIMVFWGEIWGRQSFRSQRDHRINFRRTSRRHPAGDQRNHREHCGIPYHNNETLSR